MVAIVSTSPVSMDGLFLGIPDRGVLEAESFLFPELINVSTDPEGAIEMRVMDESLAKPAVGPERRDTELEASERELASPASVVTVFRPADAYSASGSFFSSSSASA